MRKIALILFLLITVTTYAQVPSYVPADGLVGWWPFNGNSNDESGNGNNGTVNGAVSLTTDRDGNPNSAYSFPGSTSAFINVTNNISEFNDGITISVWFQDNNTSSNGRVLALGDTDGNNNGIQIMKRPNVNGIRTSFRPKFGGLAIAPTHNNIFPDDDWNHYLITIDFLDKEWTKYINGQVVASGELSGTNEDWSPFNVSGKPFNIGRKTQSAFDPWNGKIDDIGIWNRALTAEEVENLYNTCNLDFVTQPLDLTVNIGEDAEFIVESSNPEAVFQWQTDLGLGFQNLSNAGQFSGVSTSTLIVSNTTMSNNNQHFRCIISSNSCSEISDKAVLNIEDNLSNQIFYKNEIILYPNPVKDKLNVLIDGLLINSIYKVYNMNGRLIFSGKLDKTVSSIDLNNLPKGMYLIRLENKEIIKTSKFIISE